MNWSYVAARMKEASSWSGAAMMVLAVLHVTTVSSSEVDAALGIIAAIGGFIAIVIPEKTSPPPNQVAPFPPINQAPGVQK